MKTKSTIRFKMILAFIGYNLIFASILAPFVLFWGPFESLKVMAVGSVATSRHPQVVQAFLSQAEIDRIMNLNDNQGISVSQVIGRTKVISDPSTGITIEDIKGSSFKGKVMLIKDPKRVKLAVTKEIGVTGERVSDLVKDFGAIAGINAGGFYDPNGKGNGAFPDGITMHEGQLVHNNVGDKAVNIVGFNDQGKLVLGKMTAQQLVEKNMREVVTFEPNLIVEGKAMIQGDGGWGIAPRTGIGQMADGTVIFVVIDGRQPTWSIGANLRDLMHVFEDYQAVNAVNLDGGSSSELVYNGKVLNRLWNIFGERYIPTAFVVTP
jgi:exopolysaccharide biosynthesis protein